MAIMNVDCQTVYVSSELNDALSIPDKHLSVNIYPKHGVVQLKFSRY